MKPIRPDMASHPLARAAREVNAYAETHDLEATCEHYGLKLEDVMYIAEQRALRALYSQYGINLNAPSPMILKLTPEQAKQHLTLTTAYMDSLVIGWRAREMKTL
jgi:hypothetical protein